MTYGSECLAVKRQTMANLTSRNEDVEMGKREDQDHIRNEDIRKEAHVKPMETFLENGRLKWFGHCLRREHNYIGAKFLGTA